MRRPGNGRTQRVPHVFELCTESGAREGVEDEVDGVVGVHQDVHHGPDHLEWTHGRDDDGDVLAMQSG